MTREDMLAALVAQAATPRRVLGGGDMVTLRAVIEEASELGASRALARLGLGDDKASGDIVELRDLLSAWRDAKASAWKAALEWLARGIFALLLVGIAVRLGVGEVLK